MFYRIVVCSVVVLSILTLIPKTVVADDTGEIDSAQESVDAATEDDAETVEQIDAPSTEWGVAATQVWPALGITTGVVGAGMGAAAWGGNLIDDIGILEGILLMPLLAFPIVIGASLVIGSPLYAAYSVSAMGERTDINRSYLFSTIAGGVLGGVVGSLGSLQLARSLNLDWGEHPWRSGFITGAPLAAGITLGAVGGYHWRHRRTQQRQYQGYEAPRPYDRDVMVRQALIGTGVGAGLFGTGIALAVATDDLEFGSAGALLSIAVGVPVAVNTVGNRMKYPRQYMGGFVGSVVGGLVGAGVSAEQAPALIDSVVQLGAFVGGSVAGSILGYHLQAASRYRDVEPTAGGPVLAPIIDRDRDESGWTLGWQQQF